MFDRLLSALVALSLAILVWVYIRSRDQEMLDNVPVPVHIALAPSQVEQYELDVPENCHVIASFTGPPSRVRELRSQLHRGELKVDITLTAQENLQNDSPYVETVHVQASDIQSPQGVTAVVVEGHNRIPVTLHRLVERRLPIRFNHSMEDRVGAITVEPATVLVRGPKEVLDRTSVIPTQPFSLPASADSAPGQETASRVTVALARELEGRSIRATPSTVTVRFTLRPQQKIYELTDVPVYFLCPPNFGLRPQFGDERAGKLSLRIQGPAGEEPPTVTAYIDLTSGKFKPGLYADEPLRLHLPRDFQLSQKAPRSASFRLDPAEIPTIKEREGIRVP